MSRRVARLFVRPGIALAIAVALTVGCSEPAPDGLAFAPRASDDGAPDACQLLHDADPAALFGVPMGPAQRMLALCLADATGWDGRSQERSVQLEIRRADERGVPDDLDSFWLAEGAGIGFVGGDRGAIESIAGLGDLALSVPIENGRRFYAYWGGEYILLLTVLGAPDPTAAMDWSLALIRASIAASVTPRSG